jgi:hypothetical protein
VAAPEDDSAPESSSVDTVGINEESLAAEIDESSAPAEGISTQESPAAESAEVVAGAENTKEPSDESERGEEGPADEDPAFTDTTNETAASEAEEKSPLSSAGDEAVTPTKSPKQETDEITAEEATMTPTKLMEESETKAESPTSVMEPNV